MGMIIAKEAPRYLYRDAVGQWLVQLVNWPSVMFYAFVVGFAVYWMIVGVRMLRRKYGR